MCIYACMYVYMYVCMRVCVANLSNLFLCPLPQWDPSINVCVCVCVCGESLSNLSLCPLPQWDPSINQELIIIKNSFHILGSQLNYEYKNSQFNMNI